MSKDPVDIGRWLETPLGCSLLEAEGRIVNETLSTVFGFQCLQIGAWGAPDQFLSASKTLRSLLVAPSCGPGVSLVSTPGQLAIATDSVDSVLLPHTLEIDAEPHQTLREVQRVLVGDGHLMVLGFNPYGFWGLRRLIGRGRFPPRIARYISERRLRDWLTLLGLEVVGFRRYAYALPVNHESLLTRMSRMEGLGDRYWQRLSGAYMLLARKRVYTITPVRSVPRQRRRVRVALPEPSTRNCA